jgi:hypothetical protein
VIYGSLNLSFLLKKKRNCMLFKATGNVQDLFKYQGIPRKSKGQTDPKPRIESRREYKA